MNKTLVFCLLPMAVCIILFMFVLCMSLGTELPFQQSAFMQVVTKIENGTLRPDAKGIVILPAEYASLTVTGRVYIAHGDTGKLLILFPAWIGRQKIWQDDNWMCGYLYDAGSSETRKSGEVNGWSEIIPPKYVAPWEAKRDSEIEDSPIPVLTTHRYDLHWFAIEAFPS